MKREDLKVFDKTIYSTVSIKFTTVLEHAFYDSTKDIPVNINSVLNERQNQEVKKNKKTGKEKDQILHPTSSHLWNLFIMLIR